MSERGMDRPQSRMDDALVQLNERLEGLGQAITHLENRLSTVSNNNPRPLAGEMTRADEKPSGDSPLLEKLYRISADLNNQTDRIQSLMGKLDV